MWDLIVVGTISTSTVKSSENQVSATNGSVHSLNCTIIIEQYNNHESQHISLYQRSSNQRGWQRQGVAQGRG